MWAKLRYSTLCTVFLCGLKILLNSILTGTKLRDNSIKIYFQLYLKCLQNRTLLLIHILK